MNDSNFALFRTQIMGLKADTPETDIYRMWVKSTYGWDVVQEPRRGYDGAFHYLYMMVRNDGMIYIGKHDTNDFEDGYSGSGVELEPSRIQGMSFSKVVLEFFRTKEELSVAEQCVVNAKFLSERGLVLNHAIGGAEYQRNMVVPKNTEFSKGSASTRRSGYSFTDLGLKVGDELVLAGHPDVVCSVASPWEVEHPIGSGLKKKLSQATKENGVATKNPLYVWMVAKDGRRLSDIRDGLFMKK